MSTPDRFPGPGGDPGVSPWGIPASSSSTPGGHLPVFDADPGRPAEPEGFQTQTPAPPPMRSPYGVPLGAQVQPPVSPGGPPRLILPPQSFRGGPGDADPGAKRRKAFLISSLAAVAVVGVGASIAFLVDRSSAQKSASLAGTVQDTAGSPGQTPAGESTGKPDGDSQADSAQIAPGAAASSDGGPSSAASAIPHAPAPSGSTAKKPSGPVSSSAAHAATGVPSGATSARPSGSTPAPTTAKPPATSAPGTPAPPPSSDCTFLDLPAAKMPVIQQGSTNVNAVKELQCLMKKSMLGIKPLVVDGVWGPDTQAALVAFQKCNNAPTVKSPGGTPPYARLTVDGVAGQQTWADLYFWDAQYFNGVAYYCNGTR